MLNNSIINKTKWKIKDGQKTVGTFAQIGSPVSIEIMADAGFDWILIDMEHSPMGLETLLHAVMAMQGTGAEAFVRAPWNDLVMIKRILDTGVFGVMVPYVNTAEEAKQAVRACKYPPEGIRGCAYSPRGSCYGASKERLKAMNHEVCVITQIETPEAIRNLDEILRVDGLDGLFIGPGDLATSMGHMGDHNHPEVLEAIAEVEKKVFASDKFLGTVAFGWEDACRKYDKGYQFITAISDGGTLGAASRTAVKAFREKYGN